MLTAAQLSRRSPATTRSGCASSAGALPYRRTAFASFVSYVVAHNVGASFLGGAAMRLHLYSGWGLSAREVAGVIALNAVTFWLGVLVLLGVSLLVSPSVASLAVPVRRRSSPG